MPTPSLILPVTPARWRYAPAAALLICLLVCLAPIPALAQRDRYQLEGDQWKKPSTVAPDSPEGQILAIRRTLATGDAKAAKLMADAWIKKYPNNPLAVQAYLVRGDAKVARGDDYKALFDYEMVVRKYPGSDEFNIALDREFAIARLYASGVKRRFLGVRLLPAGGEAEEIFIRVQERSPGSDLGERASMALGDYYFNRGDMASAAQAYDMFLVNYPRSQSRERAMLRAIQANLATFKGPAFDPTGLIEAAERIKQYQKEFPAAAERMGSDAILVRIDESLGIKDLRRADWYLGQGRTWSAIYLYRRVVRDHPQTVAARAALQQLARLNVPAAPEAEGTPANSTSTPSLAPTQPPPTPPEAAP